ncbi:DUF2100 domain-containing protein [Methanothermobacter sp. K4]|uniref:DUF2100 domain-containing protein n=1 Tax=Methanothermobacter sp. K4 TaxID=2913262 RepID=UPI001EDBEAE8|nr:DUF2100 domain-containing protein [Methanothermobacter sp. K4]MCG2828143.1 DUF2100 domain-containing protein [Methanothermobacter sp. K4]
MEKIRFEQAEKLIRKSCSNIRRESRFRDPQDGVIDTRKFQEAMMELIEAEDHIYLSLPSHELTGDDAYDFCRSLMAAREAIDSILADFGVIEREDPSEMIKEASKGKLIIVNNSSIKKLLVKAGVEPGNILVAGVPLSVDDMKKINPRIPDGALKGIKKKIEHLKNDIERKLEGLEDILVIGEPDKSTRLLASRAEELYGAGMRLDENIRDLSPEEILKLLS